MFIASFFPDAWISLNSFRTEASLENRFITHKSTLCSVPLLSWYKLGLRDFSIFTKEGLLFLLLLFLWPLNLRFDLRRPGYGNKPETLHNPIYPVCVFFLNHNVHHPVIFPKYFCHNAATACQRETSLTGCQFNQIFFQK